RYHRRIAAYIYGMVNDYPRAEDIAQDVFMSALRRMRETERPIAFKPWIYEIAKNACIDQFRRSRRAEEVSYDADEGLAAADGGRRIQGIIAGATSGTLGTRDQRRMARHVSYCQACRRQARLAGLDASVLVHTPVRAKIAAFLPLPAFLRRRWGGGSSDG